MRLSKANLLMGLVISSFALGTTMGAYAAPKDFDESKRFIVKFKEKKDDRRSKLQRRAERLEKIKQRLARRAVKFLKRTGLDSDVFEIEGVGKFQVAATMALLRQMADVEYVEQDILMQHQAQPNDPSYSQQWHYFDQGTSINAEPAWDKATGAGVVVAVLDTGYRPHADLVGNLLPGYDMISDSFIGNDGDGRDSSALDPGDAVSSNECGFGSPAKTSSWHGTHVAGTISAVTNNGADIAGVAYDAKVVPVRVLGKCGGYTSDIADGIIWASGGSVSGVPANANPAQVINMSLGGSGSCSQTYVNAINAARANGATVIVAAGNSNTNASNAVPANCPGVVTVAATGPTGARAYYSNYGSVVDVAAPGGDLQFGQTGGVLSTLNTGSSSPGADSLAWYQGTSMATPHVAGIAALMYEAKPSATPDEIEAALVASTQPFPGSCSQCGSGITDANAAIDAIVSGSGGGGDTGGGFEPITFSVNVPDTSRRNWRHYTLDVPAGATTLNVNIFGGTGDADLYIRFGARPTTSQWDYRPYLNGNNESVSVPSPQEGTWHISVRAYSTFRGLTLDGSVQ